MIKLRLDAAAVCDTDAERVTHIALAARESCRNQKKLTRKNLLTAFS